MKNKLLPCPFCGSSATMEQTSDNRWSVGCDSPDELVCMGNQSFATFPRQREAADAWNKRPEKLRKVLIDISEMTAYSAPHISTLAKRVANDWCEACQTNHWPGQCDPDVDEQRFPR